MGADRTSPRAASAAVEPAPLQLPFEWEAWVRTVTLDLPLPALPVSWPPGGRPVVRLRSRRTRALPKIGQAEQPHLLIAEVTEEPELYQVAQAAREEAFAALLFVPQEFPARVAARAQSLAPEVAIVELGGVSEAVPALGGRAVEELVRRRVYRLLLAHWRRALADYERALTAFGLSPGPLPPRPTMAPLSTIENAHVAGVLGLWWPVRPKSWQGLGITAPTVRRIRSSLPKALLEAISEPLPASRRPLSLLIVEDDSAFAEATRRLAGALGEKRLGRALEVTVVDSAKAARARLESRGFPDLALVDVQLETPRAGVDLVRWMRTRQSTSVVLGKTALAPVGDLRDLTRLGAVGVWTSSRPKELAAMLADAVRVADEAATIAGLEKRTQELEAQLEPALERALGAAAAAERVRQARRIVDLLEVDFGSPMPVGVGDPELSIDQLRRRASKLALEAASGSFASAGRLLGIDWRRLRGYAARKKKR